MRATLLYLVMLTAFFFANAISTSYAIDISVQYAPGVLFYSGIDGTAKAAINAAAADVSEAITTSLDAITSDVVVGSSGGTTATLDALFRYTNPSTGASVDIPSATIAADEVILFVGSRKISGSTLGVGGSGGTLAGITGASGSPSGWVGAVGDAESQLNTRYSRGGGPTIGTSTGSSTYGSASASYQLDYGLTVGNLWFDIDSDDNGSVDNSSLLDDYWHWNHASDVESGKNDLYSVALHEILHAVGIGSSNSWDGLRSGSTWNGTEVQAITGSGSNLVDGAGSHIASSVMSTRISDGSTQEVVMDPTITTGSRKELTTLDLAFLRDIGYETVTPTLPSPPDYDGDGDVDAADLAVIQTYFGVNSLGDTDNDGDTDGADFLAWQQQYTGSLPLIANVPEPTSACLLVLGLAMMGRRRR